MSLSLVPRTLPLYCSFCGKEKGEVGYLVAGPTVFICNECVELCRPIGCRCSNIIELIQMPEVPRFHVEILKAAWSGIWR